MKEYLIASLQCLPIVLMKYKNALFKIFRSGIMVVVIDWIDSKAVAITVKEVFITIQIDVSLV